MSTINQLTNNQLLYIVNHVKDADSIGKNPEINDKPTKNCLVILRKQHPALLVQYDPRTDRYYTEILCDNPNWIPIGFESAYIMDSIANVAQTDK